MKPEILMTPWSLEAKVRLTTMLSHLTWICLKHSKENKKEARRRWTTKIMWSKRLLWGRTLKGWTLTRHCLRAPFRESWMIFRPMRGHTTPTWCRRRLQYGKITYRGSQTWKGPVWCDAINNKRPSSVILVDWLSPFLSVTPMRGCCRHHKYH